MSTRTRSSPAASIDGYIGNTASRLLLCNDADFDRVDAAGASYDAVLAGATTYGPTVKELFASRRRRLNHAGLRTKGRLTQLGHTRGARATAPHSVQTNTVQSIVCSVRSTLSCCQLRLLSTHIRRVTDPHLLVGGRGAATTAPRGWVGLVVEASFAAISFGLGYYK